MLFTDRILAALASRCVRLYSALKLAALAVAMAAGMTNISNAQPAWPLERPIYLIVPFPAGSSPDILITDCP